VAGAEPPRRLPTGEICVGDASSGGVYLISNVDSEPSLEEARELASRGEAIFLDRDALEIISRHFADVSVLG
jgi:hypothetical protein